MPHEGAGDVAIVGVAEAGRDAPGPEVVVVPVPDRLARPRERDGGARHERDHEEQGAEEDVGVALGAAGPAAHASSLPRAASPSRIRRK